MGQLVTLGEAASFLGVSKATLRNWDKEGKLKAHRHPINQYRVYDLEEIRALRTQTALFESDEKRLARSTETPISDQRSVRKVVSKLHNILRDTDGNSSIVQRFDELTKLLFLKLYPNGEGDDIYTRRSNENDKSYCDRIRNSYATLAKTHKELIPAKFGKLECADSAIIQSGAVLQTVSIPHADFDVKGLAYEEVIRGTFDKSDNQQFFTPQQVVGFMVSMVKSVGGGVIADPACGTGGFLAEAIRANMNLSHLVGLEIDERLAWVTRISLLLHGAKECEVACLGQGGTLGPDGERYRNSIDVILTNPPFGSDLSDHELLEVFQLGKGRGSRRRGILFIERCWELLRDDGILAIVIDEGVLNLSSAIDVRKFILAHFELMAIVSLPETAFMPYASVNASILFMKKSTRPDRNGRVLFARAEDVGRKHNGDDDIVYDANGKARLKSDLPLILEQWQSLLGGSEIATSEMAFTANVSKNLENDEAQRLDFRYHHPSRNRSKTLLQNSQFPLADLSELFEERNEVCIPSTDLGDQVILYTGLANIESDTGVAHQEPTPAASLKSAVKRYEPNDILFARMRPNLRKIALANFVEGGYASPECTVLVVRKDSEGNDVINPEIASALLRSDLVFGQITHLVAGIGRPRLNATDLRKIRLPIPPRAIQLECKASYEGRMASVRQLQEKAKLLVEEARIQESRAVDELATKMIGGKP